jgi:hypothetical protein
MTITIEPFTVEPSRQPIPTLGSHITRVESRDAGLRITYWGIYLDGKQVSYTSSSELAANTKLWMEKWLTESN